MLPDITLTASGDSDNLQVTMKRGNRLQDAQARIYAPKFPKPQTEGYFVLVTPAGSKVARESARADILALKRANWSMMNNKQGQSRAREVSHTKLKVPVLEGMVGGEVKVDILVMSDAYPGMEWWLENVVVPVAQSKAVVQTVKVNVDETLTKKKGV